MTHRRLTSVERKVRDFLGEGATIGKVASTLKMRERAVRTIVSRLENYGEIVRVPGTKSPILYELVKKDTTNPPTGGSDTEKGNYGPSVRKTPPKIDIVISKLNQNGISTARKQPGPEYARAHISGFIGMEIHRVGSLDDIPDLRGADKFGYVGYWEKPDKSMRGSTVYKSCLRINGQEIKVHYRCGNKGGKTFAIYPGQIWINPLCFDSQQDVFDVFIDFANVISEILRSQGWVVDHPQIKGKPHLAWPDHSLVQHFRSDIVAEGELICDTSTGVPEVEIEDLEKEDSWRKAQLMADLPNRFLHLESDVDMLTDGARSNTETLADIRSEIDLMISTIKDQQEANRVFTGTVGSEISTLKDTMTGVLGVMDQQAIVNVTILQELNKLQQVSTAQLQILSNILSRHQLEDGAYSQSSQQSVPAYVADGDLSSPTRLEGYQ